MNDILQFINTHPTTRYELALKGGTAINLTIFNLPRLSVDIDFDFCKECSRDEMMDVRRVINNDLLKSMFAQGYALSPNTKNPHSLDSWVFYFTNAVGNKDNLKIEINYSMRHHILPVVSKKATIDFLSSQNEWTTLSSIEIFGGKIKALLERAAPRDLYDVYNMIVSNAVSPHEYHLLRKIVLFYLVLGSQKKCAFPISFDHLNPIDYPQIRAQLIPVLRKTEKFDYKIAKTTVKDYISQLMMPLANEIAFVEQFYQGVYRPEILFEDDNIIKRIKNHPMALWKVRQ
ncbi:MAG: nucleotidyl transferase AbiEii/AbiGii toxin family protein [Prevotellaceae bacterium]|nr:nucleotidyl transferase AbiEii/AbiGii toxin family protein [Prevotellaceae bacterium]